MELRLVIGEFIKIFFIFRAQEQVSVGCWGGQTERRKESQADSVLSTERHVGLDVMTLRT